MWEFLPPGRLMIGANYWASHAGLAMWRDWQPEVVARDFERLSKVGLQTLRIFPLWPDFQPLALLRADNGRPVEFRSGETALPDDETIQHGVSAEILERFSVVLDLASRHGFELIVGLITGWMSGRLFAPPGLEGLNPITDPRSQMWQIRFARTLVSRFKTQAVIKAWDLGNECNVMGQATREQAWLWTAALANTIRAEDATRPVISGMHGLSADPNSGWTIRDQGELTDFLTTHPYPLFTPHCALEPLNTMRPVLHAAVETCLYADLSGRPAFVEEFGNLGPMVCAEPETADFARASVASLWAHDGRAALWWCAFDQSRFDFAPYEWNVVERQLGLLHEDYREKPVAAELRRLRETLASLPFPHLPPRRVDAVCLLTPGQDQWGVAFSAFLLAKQAGFDLRFHYADRALPDASLYLLPSLAGLGPLARRFENELWEKVRAGATAYVSLGDGMLGQFAQAAGMEIVTRASRVGAAEVSLADGTVFHLEAPLQYEFRPQTAEILAREENGQPIFFRNQLGAGEVFVLCAPIESKAAATPRAFGDESGQPLWRFYHTVAGRARTARHLSKANPLLGVTEHGFADGSFAAVLINYSLQPLTDTLMLSTEHRMTDVLSGRRLIASHAGRCDIELAPLAYTVWLGEPSPSA